MKEIRFSEIPLLSGLDRINVAKVIPNFERLNIKSGEILFRQGDPGDSLYIIVDGIVRIYLESGGRSREITCLGPGDCFGEMALLTGKPRSADVQAMTDLLLLRLPKDRFDHLIKKHPSLGVNFAGLLASRLTLTDAVVSGRKESVISETPSLTRVENKIAVPEVSKEIPSFVDFGFLKDKRLLGLALVTLVCILSTMFLRTTGLGKSHMILIELILAATIIWGLDIFSYHAVAVALPVLAVFFGVATPERAFSGFSSPTWFLVLGVYAISAAISKTGLLYRIALLMMKRLPPSYLGQTFGLALSGLMLTPVIPTANGRVILASPFVMTLSEILGFKSGSPGAVGIAMSCLLGYGHMLFMFMNGGATCFLVLGLLPPEVSASITWGYWLEVSLPLGIFFFLISYLAIMILYRPKEITKLSPLVIEVQLKTLGPLTSHEKISIVTVGISLLGFITQPWHRINIAWVAMLSFLILFASSVLDEKSVRSDIDWNFLISFGALVSFGSIISASGLAGVISNNVKPYLTIFAGNRLLFLIFVALTVHGIRFVLPSPPALLVSILSLMPIASALGLHPLVIGLVVLISAEPFFFPYQNLMYLNLIQSTEGKLFSHEQAVKLAWLNIFIILTAILISVPFWKLMDLIR